MALLNRRDFFHSWAVAQLEQVERPLYTCEAVLSEACYLLRQIPEGPGSVLALVGEGVLQVAFRLEEEAASIKGLLERYANVPMDLADACLVRMAERADGNMLLTLDSDFNIYRMNGRQAIPIILPDRF